MYLGKELNFDIFVTNNASITCWTALIYPGNSLVGQLFHLVWQILFALL